MHANPITDPQLERILNALWVETYQEGAYGALLTDGLILQLVAHLLQMRDEKSVSATTPRGSLSQQQLRLLTDYMEEHLAEPVNHLCRAFRAGTGVPPHRWLLGRRIQRARELLDETDLTITEIADAVGYEDPSVLAGVFRRTVGVSPSQYRQIK